MQHNNNKQTEKRDDGEKENEKDHRVSTCWRSASSMATTSKIIILGGPSTRTLRQTPPFSHSRLGHEKSASCRTPELTTIYVETGGPNDSQKHAAQPDNIFSTIRCNSRAWCKVCDMDSRPRPTR